MSERGYVVSVRGMFVRDKAIAVGDWRKARIMSHAEASLAAAYWMERGAPEVSLRLVIIDTEKECEMLCIGGEWNPT